MENHRVSKVYKFFFNIGLFVLFGIVMFNVLASRRVYYGFYLLENPEDKNWEKVLQLMGSEEKEAFFSCCVGEVVKANIENNRRQLLKKVYYLNEALKFNPYNWQIIQELIAIYEKEGRKEKVKELKKILQDYFEDIENLKSLKN